MSDFIYELDKIEESKKSKDYDEAWRIANKYIINTNTSKDNDWYMMYYQMADIAARQKLWIKSLEMMGLMIHFANFPKGVGGVAHQKFLLRLLKKYKSEDKYEEFIKLCLEADPTRLYKNINQLVVNLND